EQEKKLWLKKAEHELNVFLDEVIYDGNTANLEHCIIPNQYACVKQSGNLNVAEFLRTTATYFKDDLIDGSFDHDQLKFSNDGLLYKNISAKNIIFCEGYLVKNNPFFKWIPLKPAKGETLIISAPE